MGTLAEIQDHRAKNATRTVAYYDDERDTVRCRIHGENQQYSLVYSNLGFQRACAPCVENYFADALPASDSSTLVELCNHKDCNEPVLENLTCCWCKKTYCGAHMDNDLTCDDCEASLEPATFRDY